MHRLLSPLPAPQLLAAARTGDRLVLLGDAADDALLGWRDWALRALARSPLAGAPCIAGEHGGALVICLDVPHVVCWNAETVKYVYMPALDYVASRRCALRALHYDCRVPIERQHSARARLHDALMAASAALNDRRHGAPPALDDAALAARLLDAAAPHVAPHYADATPLPGAGLQAPPACANSSKAAPQ